MAGREVWKLILMVFQQLRFMDEETNKKPSPQIEEFRDKVGKCNGGQFPYSIPDMSRSVKESMSALT